MALIITSIKLINSIVILPLSVLILVLLGLPVSLFTVAFHVGYLISLTHVCCIVFFSLCLRIDALIYSAAQLQECLTL